MNHCVPNFETDEDYLLPASSSLTRPKKSAMGDEDIMELLWQNGQVVMQSQNQRSVGNKKVETMPLTATREIRSGGVAEEPSPCNLFMQEDEMASWLHYPNDDNSLDLYLHSNDIMYSVMPSSAPVTAAPSSLPPPPPPPLVTAPSPRPPIPPLSRIDEEPSQPKFANFLHFTRPNKGRRTGSAPSMSNKMSQSTVVESNERPPAEALESRTSRVTDSAALVSGGNVGCRRGANGFGATGTSSAGREPETCELSTTSSRGTGGSGGSASVEPSSQKPPPATNDRKRKGRDTDDNECYSEDVEFEYHDAKKQTRSTKRTRAAEVHNLSERRRRDRINEKMKALQELIPRCNKSDKASMLDEAIEYLKSLQMQVQIMSMGYGMVPMMFPGVQRYMPPMAMGMGMGMDHVGMNRGMVPYPAVLPGSALPNSVGQRFPVPQFHMAPIPVIGPSKSQPPNLSNPMMNPLPPQNPNPPRIFADPYQPYIGLHQSQLPVPQNQTRMPPVESKPSGSKDPEHQPTGKPSHFG